MKRIAAAVMFMAAAVAAHGQASGLSGTVRVMKRTLKAILALAFAATVAAAQDTNFAVRISCDFQQQAGAAELPDLTLLQGSAPMIQAAPMRMGRAVAADSLTTCQLVFGPSATSTYYVATNAYLATNSAYYIQLGTIGTNSVPAGSNSPAAWWYSILFYRNGGIYWSGSGRLYIERTTATGANGLVWQEWEAGAAKDDIARGWIADLSNVVDSIEAGGVNFGTGDHDAYRGDWGASVSNLAAQAAGWGDHAAAGYATGTPVYAETDPIFSATNAWLVRTNDSAYTATVAKAASAVQPADTNGWVVSSHSGLATEAQAGQIATNVLSNATTNDMPGVDWGSLGGGGGTADPFSSILVEADWTWTNSIYAVGANTSVTNIAITLPDAGTNFTSIVIRKFSNLNQLLIKRGTNTVYTLNDDGSARAYDWWPQRTNWFWRN